MNFKIAFLFSMFVSLASLQVCSLKRIKRNSLKEPKNSRIKLDFVALHKEIPELKGNLNKPDFKGTVLDTRATFNSSNNHTLEIHSKRNVSRPLAVILQERERKLKERLMADHKVAELTNNFPDAKLENQSMENNLDQTAVKKRFDSTERHKFHVNKHLHHMLHSTKVLGAHVFMPPQNIQPSYEVLNPMTSLDELIKFENMMMFKVGLDSLPYRSQTHQHLYSPIIMTQNSPPLQQERHFYRQTNKPSFDYIFNSIEGPLENVAKEKTAIISQPTIFFKTPVSEREPTQISNLMQTVLNKLMTNTDESGHDIELKCPMHREMKSAENANKNVDEDDGAVIQVCSCHFIKTDKQGIKPQK